MHTLYYCCSPFVEDRGRVRGFRDSIGESERPGETHLTPSAHTLRAERGLYIHFFPLKHVTVLFVLSL